ncbi:MAG TPA: hypothetical protein VM911_14995 [Pyrinomonadaceae bacterium]|jgi:hypothetical protein|nr:hypothetical protein [Pyrinomonadaceae bacterium]
MFNITFEDQRAMLNITGQGNDRYGVAERLCAIWTAASHASSEEGTARGDDPDAGLEDVARHEREYVRRRLREELKREPTDEEMDEWLRQQTEGH